MLDVVTALTTHRPCPCDCDRTLTHAEKLAGIQAVYVLDAAIRGWGYRPIYDVNGDALFREAQRRNDPAYRGVAVRFGECIYRRLVGSMLHECIHALHGDTTQANYGVLFGLPYAVPSALPESDEAAFLEPFNVGEARAWAGVWILGARMFGLAWELRTARDVGTYGFVGGNALVPPTPGHRAVAHIDRQHHPERYYARARKLEAEARAWFQVDANLEGCVRRITEAAARGLRRRPRTYPEPAEIARLAPRKIGRNEPCVCGSARKFKECCEGKDEIATWLPANAR
jgi:hypothetical protein